MELKDKILQKIESKEFECLPRHGGLYQFNVIIDIEDKEYQLDCVQYGNPIGSYDRWKYIVLHQIENKWSPVCGADYIFTDEKICTFEGHEL